MKLYLVRHGETIWNEQSRYQGHSDVELSAMGQKQGELLGARMAKLEINAVYASDLSRAYETAKYIAAWHQLEVKKTFQLRELNFGVWEGLTFKEINESYSDLVTKWYENPDELIIPEGELFTDLSVRANQFVNSLMKNYEGKNVVIVSHGGTIRTIICGLLELNLNRIWAIKQDNTAVNLIEFFRNRPVLSLLNDTHHLETIEIKNKIYES